MAASSICPPEYNLTREPCAVDRSLIIYQLASRYITILKIISLTSSVLTIFGVLVSRRRYMRLVCLFYRFFSLSYSSNPPCIPSVLNSQPPSPAPFLCCLQFSFMLRIYSQRTPPILKMQQAMPTSAVVYVAR
jgi:hypothetical protein